MTDRELLEWAAKAAGIAIDPIDAAHEPDHWEVWNPLTDDGDALRLAVVLDFGIEVHQSLAVVRAGNGEQDPVSVHWNLVDVPDAFTATRRAIVRAAAEIGKAMP